MERLRYNYWLAAHPHLNNWWESSPWKKIPMIELNFPEAAVGEYPHNAAQEPHSQENWHPRLADRFQFFGIDGE